MKKTSFYTRNNSFQSFDAPSINSDNQQNQNGTAMPQGIEDEINKYSGMSEERLMQEMFHLVEEGRKNGTLDNKKLEDFFNSASCMLSGEQITKLRSIIDMAKNG